MPPRPTHPAPHASNGAPSPRADNPFRAFVRTTGLVRHIMRPYFARFGISGAQWGVLRALSRSPAGLRITDLGDHLLVRPPSITGVVDRLQRQNLVAKSHDRGDLRAKRVRLTRQGRLLVNRIQNAHPAQIQSLLAGLSARDQSQMSRILTRWSDHLQTIAHRAAPPTDREHEQ